MPEDEGTVADQYAVMGDTNRVDLGWAVGTFRDGIFTRTCKGCGVAAASRAVVDAQGVLQIEPREVHHSDGCVEHEKVRAGRYRGLS